MSTDDRSSDDAAASTVAAEDGVVGEDGRIRDDWYRLLTDVVLQLLKASPGGLTSDEAEQRLERFGPNFLPVAQGASAWIRFLLQFHNPLIYVLLAAGVITAALGEWIDSLVIVGVAVINAIVGFVQETKAEKAIASLRQMLAPSAMVVRDGLKQKLSATRLVPGDIVLLQAGDRVPADVRWLDVRNVYVDESALTGESVPLPKTARVLEGELHVADRANLSYSGTLIVAGSGTAVVVATGSATEVGKLAGMLSDVVSVDTPLTKRLAQFSKVITIVILVACALVVLTGTFLGLPLFDLFMASVALAVSAIPEGLPAIMTIALAIGVKRMARRNAIIRKLPAVETLGSVTVICTDKTGTLTRNEMTVTRVMTPSGDLRVEGIGYAPIGRVLDSAGRSVSCQQDAPSCELFRAGVLCNEAVHRQEQGNWRIDGDPTEGALIVLARKAGLDPDAETRRRVRVDVIPFDSERQFMASLHRDENGSALVYLKGAPEVVLKKCESLWHSDVPLDREAWERRAVELASSGLRVLGLAVKRISDPHDALQESDVEGGFALLGLVGIIDPARPEAIEAVRACREAGIRVKMITGDHVRTAVAIAREVGIRSDGALSGQEISVMSDEQFRQAAVEVDVFARVTPAHKLRLVQALQAHNEVVAMTGDGVNDAPALRQADVGIAMGITGTEVAKEAADMVLVDDNFASIERAVEEGRTVFNNLRKTILFILPTNGGECLTLVAAIFMGAVLPILPLHILWINLITTVALAITLAFEPTEPGTMKQPPRRPDAPLIDRVLVWRTIYVSILLALGTFALFEHAVRADVGLRAARTTAVNAIVFFEAVYLFNARKLSAPVMNRDGLLGNHAVLLGVAVVIPAQVVFTYWPAANRLFGSAPVTLSAWGAVSLAALSLFVIVELEKAVARRLMRATDKARAGD